MTTLRITALVKITSHGSGGRGRIIDCPFMSDVARDQLTSTHFKNYEVGSYVVVNLLYVVETKMRKTKKVNQYKPANPFAIVASFRDEFSEELERQKSIGAPYMGYPIESESEFVPTPEPVEIPEVKELVTDRWCDAFYVQDEERNAFEMARLLSGKIPSKVMIIGASGYGKTSLPKAFAKQHSMEYVRFNVALVRDPEEFFGWRTVVDGDVKFMPSEFTQAITRGNAVVVLDELNRATPEMANALFPILDDDARTVVFGEEVKVAENVIFVCTVNIGYQFVGTYALDQALVNRMDITLRVAPLPVEVEREILVRRTGIDRDKATLVVAVCNRLRDLTNDGKIVVDASTRTSIRVARFIASGASFQDAFAWGLVNGCDVEERKEIVDTISGIVF